MLAKTVEYALKAVVTAVVTTVAAGVSRVVSDKYNDRRAQNGYGHYVRSHR